ncbi:MAG: ATP-binding protein, partial [Bacillota bacterium]|nr:ATP-binding protein [Bacillota bacterium]
MSHGREQRNINIILENFISGENIYLVSSFLAIAVIVCIGSLNSLISLTKIYIMILSILILFISVNGQTDNTMDGNTNTRILGISFGSTGSFYIVLLSLQLQSNHTMETEVGLMLSAGFVEAAGILLFAFLPNRRKNNRNVSIVFFIAPLLIILAESRLKSSSFLLYDGSACTGLFLILSYILSGCYTAGIVGVFIKRKVYQFENRKMLYAFLILIVISAFCQMLFYRDIYTLSLLIYSVKLIAYVILYKVILIDSMRKPMKKIYNDMLDYQNSLKINNRTLQETVERLERQIIARNRYERRLKHAEEKYQKIVDNSPETIYIHDGEVIIFMNKAARNFFAPDDVHQHRDISILDIADEKVRGIIGERLYKTQYEKRDFEPMEIKCKCFDGVNRVLEAADIHINIDGKNVTLSIGRDITSEKKMEEDRKKLTEAMEYEKIRSNFFSNISHELRTPINIIYSSLQVIELYKKSGIESVEYNKYYYSMKKGCLRLTRIINNLIDITKMDSGYYVPDYKYVEIVSVIEDITMAVSQYIRNKNINVVFDTDVEEKLMYVDQNLITRMILNLLSNSVKFIDGSGNIEVNLKDRSGGIEIQVKDNGVGIPVEHIDMIFDKFRQVDKSLRRGQEG